MSTGVGKTIVCTTLIVNVRVTGVAAAYNIPRTVVAAAFAVMVQSPNVRSVTNPADVTVQTDVVNELNVTAMPELDVATRRNAPPPESLSGGVPKVIV